ncbi:MAG: hypothetical protein GX660_13125, partial [Clostridiaceae bacterium]|nr:hypothetical protein [Clostridiaceae bacterium]
KETIQDYDIVVNEFSLEKIKNLGIKAKSKYLKEPNCSFNLNFNELIDNIFSKPHKKLDDLCQINQAIALKGDKNLSLKYENPNNKYYKLLDGRNINKYSIQWDGTYLDYNLKRIHSCKRKDIFETPEKLFFRRVSTNLIFTYDNEQYFALNTLVVLNKKPGINISLKYILAILNSELLNHIYSIKFKSTKNVFSEIQAHSVGFLPIIISNSVEVIETLVTLVDYLLVINKTNNLSSSEKEMQNSFFQQIIDGITYELYFEEQLRSTNRDIIQYLKTLPKISNKTSEAQKINLISDIFNKLYDEKSPVRNNLFFMDTIVEIRIIKGLDKK